MSNADVSAFDVNNAAFEKRERIKPDIVQPYMAARAVGISRQRLHQWIKAGRVGSVAVYGKRWVSIEEVMECKTRMDSKG